MGVTPKPLKRKKKEYLWGYFFRRFLTVLVASLEGSRRLCGLSQQHSDCLWNQECFRVQAWFWLYCAVLSLAQLLGSPIILLLFCLPSRAQCWGTSVPDVRAQPQPPWNRLPLDSRGEGSGGSS